MHLILRAAGSRWRALGKKDCYRMCWDVFPVAAAWSTDWRKAGMEAGGPGAEAAAEAWMEALEVGRRGRWNSKRRDRNDKAERFGACGP